MQVQTPKLQPFPCCTTSFTLSTEHSGKTPDKPHPNKSTIDPQSNHASVYPPIFDTLEWMDM